MTLAEAARRQGMIVEGAYLYTHDAGPRRTWVTPPLTVDWWLGRTVRAAGDLFLVREYDPARGLLFEAVYLDGPPSFYLPVPAASARLRTGAFREEDA